MGESLPARINQKRTLRFAKSGGNIAARKKGVGGESEFFPDIETIIVSAA